MISRGSKSPTRQLLPIFEVFSCVSTPQINSCYWITNWLPPDFYEPHRGNTVQVALYLPSVRGGLGWLQVVARYSDSGWALFDLRGASKHVQEALRTFDGFAFYITLLSVLSLHFSSAHSFSSSGRRSRYLKNPELWICK